MINGRRIASALALMAGIIALGAYSIPSEQLDRQKVFWGSHEQFEKPAEVKYDEVVKATPEYKQIKKDNVERGTGKYWILLSQASDRTVKTISKVGEETPYDLIAAAGYLGTLEPAIPADDITKQVIEALVEEKESD